MKTKFIPLLAAIALPIVSPSVSAQFCDEDEFLGVLSANPYLADSTSNEFGKFGSPFEADSISNPFGKFGSPYSATSVSNPYATSAPGIESRRVKPNGMINFEGKVYFLSTALAGWDVGLAPVEGGRWEVRFGRLFLGHLETATEAFLPIVAQTSQEVPKAA